MFTAKVHTINSEISIEGLDVTQIAKTIYTAPENGTFINVLQLTNNGDKDTAGKVKCFTIENEEYRVIPFAIRPYKTISVLENYALMEEGQYMTIEADSNDIGAVLTVTDKGPVI